MPHRYLSFETTAWWRENKQSDLASLAVKHRLQVGNQHSPLRSHWRRTSENKKRRQSRPPHLNRRYQQCWLNGRRSSLNPLRAARKRQPLNLTQSRDAQSIIRASVTLLATTSCSIRCMTVCRHEASRLWKRHNCSQSRQPHKPRSNLRRALRPRSRECDEC